MLARERVKRGGPVVGTKAPPAPAVKKKKG